MKEKDNIAEKEGIELVEGDHPPPTMKKKECTGAAKGTSERKENHPKNIELVQGSKNEVLPSFLPSLTNLKGKSIFLYNFFRKHPNASNCSRINQFFIFLKQRTPADK